MKFLTTLAVSILILTGSQAAMQKPSSRETLARQGLTVAVRAPAELAAALPGEVEKWAAVIKAANLSAE